MRLPKKIRKDFKPTIKELDKLWAKAIKLRANNRSELKHIEDSVLHAHHILGKPTHSLRWSLDNGICITGGQHFYVAHHTGRSSQFKETALKIRGITEEQLRMTERNRVDRFMVKLYLEAEIKEYEALNAKR